MEIFEWKRLLFNDLPGKFLLEVIFRSLVMFIVLLIALRVTGKRGVRQLSIFEIVIIIALGSAGGDPMFYEDVGLIPAIIVFIVIISLYRLVTWLIGKSRWFQILVEGKTVWVINEGRFYIERFAKEGLAQDEFFSELRTKSIEHLGQVKNAFLEPSGEISIFYYADSDVKHGMPLLPHLFNNKSESIPAPGIYSCTFCGFTQHLEAGKAICEICDGIEWVEAIKTIRRN
jgi:uncharacterized membrane protein YcaP (DUF421 family)